MFDDFENDPEFVEDTAKPDSRGRFRLGPVFAFLGVLVLLFALSMPAHRSAREAARRAWCANTLKQIGLALRNYESVYHAFPPLYTVDAQGRPLHSWRTLILPYLDEESLYRTIDLSKPWNDPANAAALATEVDVFRCPTAMRRGNTTSYLGIVGPDSFWVRGKARRLDEIIDDRGATLMVLEVDDEHAVPWMAPTDANESVLLGFWPDTKTHHPGGMNAGFVDGSVHFLKMTVPAEVRRALITTYGGEPVNSDQY